MKVTIIGTYDGEHHKIGVFRLNGARVAYAINPTFPDKKFARKMMVGIYQDPLGGVGRGATPSNNPEAWLRALAFNYTSPYLRATMVPPEEVKKEFVESEHPREPAGSEGGGQFTSGGGGGGVAADDTKTWAGSKSPEDQAWDESEHPRDERGRFAIGGGANAGMGHPLYGGADDPDAKAAADEYDAAPEVGPGAKEAWAKLATDTSAKYDEIAAKVKVERVTGQPYKSAEEMIKDIESGTFKVTTDHSEHPLWDVDQNFKFRVVHDYIGHYQGGNDFSMEGERAAFQEHARYIEDGEARKAAQVEIHSQAAAFTKHKAFQKQKVYLPKVALKDTGLPKQTYRDEPDPKDFIAARDKSPRGDFFSHLEPKDLTHHTLILNKEGTAGAALAPDGDIQNIFRNPGAPRGAGTVAALEAVKHGGFMLDAYDYERKGRPGLPDVYRAAGFVETGRMKFNPAYRPQWAPERQPDVVFMAYVGGDQSGSPKSTNYYASHEWDKAKLESAARAKKPRVGVRPSVEDQLAEQNARRRARQRFPGEGLLATAAQEADEARLRGFNIGKKAALTPAEVESEKIKRNKKLWGSKTHRFRAAEWTHPNGHPRCVRCGDEEPSDGLCMPALQKYARMLDAWSAKFASDFSATIESERASMSKRNWIADFHFKCIEKGEACTVKWPVCPAKKVEKGTTPVEKDGLSRTAVEKYIKEENGKFCVYSEAGKKLGTHATRAEAAAQLRAIEVNKAAEPDAATVSALQGAWDEYAKSRGLVFKSEEIMAEPVEPGVFRVADGRGGKVYFAVEGDKAQRIEYQRKMGALVAVTKAEKQRYTLGAVYAPGEVDFHGDTMTETELEKAAWAFAQKDGLTGRVGLMHQSGTEKAGKVVESYVYRGPVWKFKDTAGNEQTITPGTWMLGVVWESEGWAKIERGAVRGYSLQGVARKFANGEEV